MGIQSPGEGPCRIAIVGGGAAGVTCAISLLRRVETELEITVFEPRERLAEGIAYGTHDAEHLLNVRAANMSAHADLPDSFRDWAESGPTSYLPRRDYAAYLREQLALSEDARGITVHHERELVTRIERTANGYMVHDSSEVARPVDAVILATGNEPPSLPGSITIGSGAHGRIVENPWEENIDRSGRTLVIGSGLTAVDVCLSTLARDPKASVRLVSRHGLLPTVHDSPWKPPLPTPLFTAMDFRRGMTLSAALRAIRATGDEWRSAMDSLRPVTQEIWRSLSIAQREQFLRHLARFWDVHRHRMAPFVGRLISEWQAQGRLKIVSGEVTSVRESGDEVVVRDSCGRFWGADRVVIATGPEASCDRNALLAQLHQSGIVQPGPSGIGIAMDPDTYGVIDAANRVSTSMYVIGSPAKGVLFESTAMPDIRNAAVVIAEAVRDELAGHTDPVTSIEAIA